VLNKAKRYNFLLKYVVCIICISVYAFVSVCFSGIHPNSVKVMEGHAHKIMDYCLTKMCSSNYKCSIMCLYDVSCIYRA